MAPIKGSTIAKTASKARPTAKTKASTSSTRNATASSSKSTLGEANHRFPPFYACYLLKSVRTARSSATYIGSTPHPPRRIRQHNGQLSAGAWKTSRNRPWVMQMIVFGFASKLAALQFEWAWQHPYLSRFVREAEGVGDGKGRGRNMSLGANVRVAHAMLRTHPYNTWPLHVKLFTREAVTTWRSLTSNSTSKTKKGAPFILPRVSELITGLPEGKRDLDGPYLTTVSIELEGVDGAAEDDLLDERTRRKAPIEVTDESFTSTYLAKHTRLLASGKRTECLVCRESIDFVQSNPLTVSLCPSSGCVGVAHLKCLSERFLLEQPSGTTSEIMPRGGTCPSCREYVLWGSIIRGCYRRHTGAKGAMLSEVEEDENEIREESDEEEVVHVTPTKRKRGRPKKKSVEESSGEEFFDIYAVSSASESEGGQEGQLSRGLSAMSLAAD